MKLFFQILALLLSLNLALAQCEGDLSWDFDEEPKAGFSLGKFLSDTFTPELVIDTKAIRNYVRDARFKTLTERCGDLTAIDHIYLKSLKKADFNIGRALVLAMMTVLEHQRLHVNVPIVNSVAVPLTFEDDSLFKARVANLPGKIYPDSPGGAEQDKDKLQHFFASAYLAYASESPELAKSAGNMVEWAEAKFVVGGADDPRDRRANQQGRLFGRDLLTVKELLPSDYLTLSYKE
jgi:hypothetical protein